MKKEIQRFRGKGLSEDNVGQACASQRDALKVYHAVFKASKSGSTSAVLVQHCCHATATMQRTRNCCRFSKRQRVTQIAVLATLCVSLLALLPVFPGEALTPSVTSSSRRRPFATVVVGSPRQRSTRFLSHPDADEFNQSDPLDTSLTLPCPVLWQDAPVPKPQKRLLVISIGGVGTTALMEALRASLRAIHYEMNAIPDADLLKHAPYGILGRTRVLRRSPAAILYLIGNPIAALESHFRRGWAGFQVRPCTPVQRSLAHLFFSL